MPSIVRCLLVVLLLFSAFGCGGPQIQVTKGPYLQNVTQTAVTILWETNRHSISQVSYRLPGESLPERILSPEHVRMHRVRITGLQPDTLYEYKVSSGLVTDSGRFQTAVPPGQPFRFAVYGDSRSNPDTHRKIAQAIDWAEPRFILHTGDLVGSGHRLKDWQRDVFDPLADVIDHLPLYPTLGNHEAHSSLYRRFFGLPTDPEQDAPDGEEDWYRFDYGDARFIALDSDRPYDECAPGSRQYEWLVTQLDTNPHPWTFVYFHHPPFSSGRHGSSLKIRRAWVDLLLQYGVDVVFSGHDHGYERTYPIRRMSERRSMPVTFIVTGGGGAPLHPVTPQVWTLRSASVPHFLTVDVLGDRAELTTYQQDGMVIDTLTIHKQKRRPVYDSLSMAYELIELERFLADELPPPHLGLLPEVPSEQPLVLHLSNPFSFAVKLTASWEISPTTGWRIDLPPDPVELAPQTEQELTVPIQVDPGRMYPLPKLRLQYSTAYGDGEVEVGSIRVRYARRLTCPRLGAPINVHGQLVEPGWETAGHIQEAFLDQGSQGAAKFGTEVWAGYDDRAFYFGFEMADAEPDKLRANTLSPPNLGSEDAIGVYLATPGMEVPVGFLLNARGTRRVIDAQQQLKSVVWTAAVGRTAEGWSAEIRVPFDSLGRVPTPGEEWGLQIVRNSRLEGKSRWGAFTDGEMFGVLAIQ